MFRLALPAAAGSPYHPLRMRPLVLVFKKSLGAVSHAWLACSLIAAAALAADPVPDFLRLAEIEIGRAADADLAEERRLYWRKCSLALKARRDSRSHALRGVGLFLATVPLEYSISRYRHIRKAEP